MKTDSELSFFSQVYEVVRLIPAGRVTTYGAVAKAIGSPGASRMVGWALNQSSDKMPWVPAHRVVNRNGLLTGKFHFGTDDKMKNLLEQEGVKIEDNKVVDMQNIFWNPIEEIEF